MAGNSLILSNAFTPLFNTPAVCLHPCSAHQQRLYTFVQYTSNVFTPLFNTSAMRLHPCSTRQQCVYTLVQHSSNAFTSLFNIPAMRLHPCSTFQQYVYTLVQQISITSTPLFNKPTVCNYTLLQRTSNMYNLHRSSTTTSASEPLFNDQQCTDPARSPFSSKR